MIQIKEMSRTRINVLPIGAILAFVGLMVAAIVGITLVRADAPTIINVTTIVDEDATPGLGCSIYEATVAANTAAAYGGCSAGSSGGNNVIVIPAGTYVRDVTSDDSNAYRTLELNNTSILGAGSDQTILQAYWFDMTGDEAASIKNAEFSNITGDVTHNPSLDFYINGSNKTLDSLVLATDLVGSAPVNINLASDGGSITNVTVSNVETSQYATSGINCDAGTCSGVYINNFTGDAVYQSSIKLGSVDLVTIQNSSVTSQSTADMVIGTNATIDTVELHLLDAGSSDLTTGAGSTIDGVIQDSIGANGALGIGGVADSILNVSQQNNPSSGNGVRTEFTATSPLVQGYTANGTDVSYENSYNGGELSDVDMSSTTSTAAITTSADLVENVALSSPDGSVASLTSSHDDTTFRGLHITSQATTGTGISVNIAGDNNIYENSSFDSQNPQTAVTFSGTNPTFTNTYFHNITPNISLSAPSDITIDHMSVDGAQIFAVYMTGAPFVNASITNSDFKNTTYGLYPGSGESLTIDNVSLTDLGSAGSPAAIYISDVNFVTIKNTTIARTISSSGLGAIFIQGGETHTISNTTIIDSTAGIAVISTGDGQSVNATVNNVTIRNNEDTGDYADNVNHNALYAGGTATDAATMTVTNSIIAGESHFVDCVVDAYGTIAGSNNLATSSATCGEGFSAIDDLSTLVAATEASNSSDSEVLGYNDLGGVVKTLAVPANSQAVGQGNASTCALYDARSKQRDLTVGCDVGAYQYSIVIPVVTTPTDSGSSNGTSGGNGAVISSSTTPIGSRYISSNETTSTNDSGKNVDSVDNTANQEPTNGSTQQSEAASESNGTQPQPGSIVPIVVVTVIILTVGGIAVVIVRRP